MFDQILDLVGQPPGSLVYHFIILFAVEAAFAICIGQWMRDRDTSTLRLTIAIFAIFLARVAVLIASLAAWQGYLPRNVLLPPIERAVDTISVLGLAWSFITMDDPHILRRNFVPDVAAVVVLGITIIGFGGTYYYWIFAASSGGLFNGLWLDTAWGVAQILIALIGLIWMTTRVRYVYDPFLKGIMLIIVATAAAIHLVRPVLGDVAAAMRVGQLIVLPMVAAIAYRHVVEQLLHWDEFEPSRLMPQQPAAAPREIATTPGLAEAPRAMPLEPPPGSRDETVRSVAEPSAQPKPSQPTLPPTLDIVDALGGLLSTLEPSDLVVEAPKVVATVLRADVCVLALVDESIVQAQIVGGYDNISQVALHRATLDLADHPSIVNALGRLRQMRLSVQREGRELRDLYSKLSISHEGPAYIQPLVHGEERIGVLIVASPYSERLLSNDERNLLDRLSPLVTAALLNAESYRDAIEESDEATAQEAARAAALSDELTAKSAELNTAQRQISEMKAYIRDMHRQLEQVPRQQEVAREQIESLVAEIDRLRSEVEAVESLREENEKLKEASTEVERLREAAARASDLAREVEQLREQLKARELTLATPSADQIMLQRQLEEARLAAQNEIVALRTRLTQASISQQEVSFLQEQLAAKAREAIQLQTRLTEAQAVVEALREQIGGGVGGMRELEVLQMRVAAQATEISELRRQLADAEAAANLDAEALQAQQEMDQFDREAMAQLEAQLAERAALVEALEAQLAEKTRAVVELRSHMAEVNASLRNLEEQLGHKTEEIVALQESLARTRAEAQERITALQTALESGAGSAAEVDRARVEALEAELNEKTAALKALESQLQRTTQAVAGLEDQLTATNQAVDAAISESAQVDAHDEVIASIAQELRTPMSSIMGYTELLLRESVGILGPLQRKFLQRVKANTERMGALLDDLIRITALNTGRMLLEPEKIDVFYAVEEIVMNVANQYNEKGLTLRMALPEELPPITADRDALLEIIEHLLSNAALASPVEGEVHLFVDTRQDTIPGQDGSSTSAYCLHVAVEDSGAGVSPDDYERVFMRKYRADNPLIEGLGDTGVGLSLAKALVDAHGGRIWLESQKSAGTTFHVLLPLEPIVRGESS